MVFFNALIVIINMPLSLTNDQELTEYFKKLNDISNSIPEAFFSSFLNDKICDEPSNRVKVAGYRIGIFGTLSKIDVAEEQKKRSALLKQVSEIITKIKEIQGKLLEDNKDQRQDEFKSILDTTYKYHYSTGFCSSQYSGFRMSDETTLTIKTEPVNLGYIIDNLMPKCVILGQIDLLVAPTQAKLDKLIKKAKKDPKYETVKVVAQEVIEAADKARKIIIETTSIKEGLSQTEQIITDIYTENNNSIFAEHRGNPIVNTLINFLQQLAGYCILIITYPFRLYDNEGIKSYVNSWFEKRQTESMKIFGTFKKEMTAVNLEELAGLKMN